MPYSFSKTIDMTFDEAVSSVKQELQREGFGVLTEIDVKETLKQKLNVDFQRYTILGACNPSFAYEALQLENEVGVMLPCNVIVQEHAGGGVRISAVDPVASMQAIDNPNLNEIANQVRDKLRSVIDAL